MVTETKFHVVSDDMSTMQSTGNTGQIPNYLQNFQNAFNYSNVDRFCGHKIMNYEEIRRSNVNDPFSDIPIAYYLSLSQLIEIHKVSLGPGNFAKNISEKLYPELFGPDHLRTGFSYFGGGRLDKKELDPIRKFYLKQYVLFFHPELNSDHLWKETAISKINENLRRPVDKKRILYKSTSVL